MLAAHVDDFIWGGGGGRTERFRQTVIEYVRQCLNVCPPGKFCFKSEPNQTQ